LATTLCGTGDVELESQIKQIIDCISLHDQVVVHMVSNHGHESWIKLLGRHAHPLAQKVVALVLDCGPGLLSDLTSTHKCQAALGTVHAAMSSHNMEFSSVGERKEFDRRLSQHAERMSLAHESIVSWCDVARLKWECNSTPNIPTLILYSNTDKVIPAESMRKVANLMKEMCPSRRIESVCLPTGEHARLAESSFSHIKHIIHNFLRSTSVLD